MSRFFSQKYADLAPYTPGEQPRDLQRFIKLNTNESPFPPSIRAQAAAAAAAAKLQLYSDPTCRALAEKWAEVYGFSEEEVVFGNGSDEILYFAFLAYCDETHPAAFPAISYGFYPVFARFCRIPYTEIPMEKDLSIDPLRFCGLNKTIIIANPNAPTGLALTRDQIEQILRSNPDNVVVVDEAYVDFGAESCLPLIRRHDNLLVVQTFSKSRSMAGARLGFAAGDPALIRDLNAVRYSTNPYNINSMTMAAGIGVLSDEEYTRANCRTICETRAFAAEGLAALGFDLTDSKTNFLFARHPAIDGETLYKKLKDRGILVRHFDKDGIREYNRITVGTKDQMQVLLMQISGILREQGACGR